MQAIVYTRYGNPDVLELREIEKPTPAANQVLVRVRAVGLNAYDWHNLKADPFLVRLSSGLFKPKKMMIPGADIAGVVAAVGTEVTGFQPGERVYGECGGGLAELAATAAKNLAHMPTNLSFEEAAAVPMGALTALQGLRDKGQLKPGQQVLIYGASGGVGSFAVQLAHWMGGEVTATTSPTKLEMVRELGADHVIDYTQYDFSGLAGRFDLILAVNGNQPLSFYKRLLKPQGIYVMAGGGNRQIFQSVLLGSLNSKKGGRQMGTLLALTNQADLILIKELIEAGRVKVVMDRVYPFEQAADALRYVIDGHARGKVVVRGVEPA